jgi:hypothetical protein
VIEFSKEIIEEYKTEMSQTYGVFVSDADAQTQLLTLVRSMFPIVIAEQKTESREQGASKGGLPPTCAGSLSVTLER